MKNLFQWQNLIKVVFVISVMHTLLSLVGLYSNWHPDEWRITLETLAMGQSRSLIPTSVNYPMFFRYLLLLVYGIWFIGGYIIGIFNSVWDFAFLYFKNPEYFLIIPRIINILLGILTIIGTYRVATHYFNKTTGAIAAIFSAVEFQLFVQSQTGLHQTFATLSTLPIFFYTKSYLDKPNSKHLYLLAFFVGIGASIHHTTILFLPLLLYVIINSLPHMPIRKNIKNYITAFIICLLTALLGNLSWIFKLDDSLNFLNLGNDVSRIAFSSHQYFKYSIPSFITWFLIELTRKDYLLGVLMFFSSFSFIYKREKKYLIILIFFGTYVLYFYHWAYRWLHILIGIIPILTIYAADLFTTILNNIKNYWIKYLLLLMAIIPNSLSLFVLAINRQRVDTREVALDWISKNIPVDTKIAIDWSAYSPEIPSTPPVYLLNPNGRQFFDQQIPDDLKKRLANRNKYSVIQSIYQTEYPIWPDNMPLDEISKANKYSIYRDLYKYFNFLPTKTLAADFGVDYLIITSYTYTMFLNDNDPNKKNLFNIYINDNMVAYHSHTDQVSEDERHRLLSYLIKRAQDFYTPLLLGKDDNYVEVKRISPSRIFSGPDVVIYKRLNK